jgi:hypothetical protein
MPSTGKLVAVPSQVRLSKHFLLSDFLGCDSVYRKGYINRFEDEDGTRLREGTALCKHVLEPLLKQSRLSISYGFISPSLSKQIVKYQNPDKPSYHRWDAGAACDVVLHDAVNEGIAPIYSAFWIDENLPVSRVITYSESSFICVASRYDEIKSGDYRRALYENRYEGHRKPRFINYSDNPTSRLAQKAAVALYEPWEGAGHPTYHGGGKKQYQHHRTSMYTVLSDFLYSDEAVWFGYQNNPPEEAISLFEQAGAIYDELVNRLGIRRLSIVRGYESPEWIKSRHNWEDGIYLVVVPPHGVDSMDVATEALGIKNVKVVRKGRNKRIAIAASIG